MKRLADALIYGLLRISLGTLSVLPIPLAYRLCGALATVVFLLDGRHRRIGMINLGIAFPEKSEGWKTQTLRRSFQRLGHHLVELSRLHRLTREKALQRVHYEEGRGLEQYREASQQRPGILFLTAHISAWELLPVAHALHCNPLDFVVRPLDNPLLDAWLTRIRSRVGNRVISKQGSARAILRDLEEGRDVGFLMDQNSQQKEGVYVPLFGRLACTHSSLAALALRTGRPIVPGFIYPAERLGHYTIRFYPPLRLASRGESEVDIREGTALLNGYIEEVIREHPDCWLWGHRRFQTQPGGHSPYL